MSNLLETAPPPNRAAILLPWDKSLARLSPSSREAEARMAEAVGLAASIGLVVVHEAVYALRHQTPATLFGKGQTEQVAQAIAANDVQVAVVDAKLTPVQQRNLETAWKCKVIDRTGLILDIFGARARTREGTLQVELAHLEYQRSRLVRSWTHLERQRGGFGFLGGPGETQIEADRRLIGDRITRLKLELDEVRRTRGLHRGARKRVPCPVVALVGYTNAGKSTLFNAITGASVMAEDQLFATLDPTMRGFSLPSGRNIIISDTVGFISDLPTELVAAFRATLEEVAEADLILHVRDIAHPDSTAQRADVLAVLNGLVKDGTLDESWQERCLEVLNKADLVGGIANVSARDDTSIAVSAITGEGLPALLSAIDRRLAAQLITLECDISVSDGAKISWLYRHGEVLQRQDGEELVHMQVRMSEADRARFERL
ncbi:MAG: GTPase HflX [Acidocella sp. 20-57-95]|nr:MAG: GTPase HflX [Acidocella sp. 20-57-95]OYV61731.1 MAG: GTPase HflX [Acidocella sp. 21-58-7]HQT65194.1 GTPase HflX [Acidocella sp.]HQU04645.1 GTPase HflX [Acidocella sp.]